MTFDELATATLSDRFSPERKPDAKRWLVNRYGKVWAAADWPVKQSAVATLAVTAGSATSAVVPATLAAQTDPAQVFDQYGELVPYVTPAEFYRLFQSDVAANVRGPALAWTIDTDATGTSTIRFGPTPDTTVSFTIRGFQGPVHRTVAAPTVYVAGTLSADTDVPWFPDDYHDTLVSGAMALGLKRENDPTYGPLDDEFRDGIADMIDELLPRQRGIRQWGRVSYEGWG